MMNKMHDNEHISDCLISRNRVVTPDDLVNKSIANSSESAAYKNECNKIFGWNGTEDVVVGIDLV